MIFNSVISGGSSPEMCTVTVNGECYGMASVLYMSADGTCVYDEAPYGKGTFTVPKNSIFVVLYDTVYASSGNKMYNPSPTGDCLLRASSGDYGEGSLVLEVNGDCGISFYGY